MTLSRNKLYLILSIACLAGYVWLYLGLKSISNAQTNSFDVCIIKNITTLPCPSCGSTRSVISLTKGDFKEALIINPFGYIISLIMLISPFWIIFDLTTKKATLFQLYKKIEYKLRKPHYAIPLILLVILNWIWNITKGL